MKRLALLGMGKLSGAAIAELPICLSNGTLGDKIGLSLVAIALFVRISMKQVALVQWARGKYRGSLSFLLGDLTVGMIVVAAVALLMLLGPMGGPSTPH